MILEDSMPTGLKLDNTTFAILNRNEDNEFELIRHGKAFERMMALQCKIGDASVKNGHGKLLLDNMVNLKSQSLR